MSHTSEVQYSSVCLSGTPPTTSTSISSSLSTAKFLKLPLPLLPRKPPKQFQALSLFHKKTDNGSQHTFPPCNSYPATGLLFLDRPVETHYPSHRLDRWTRSRPNRKELCPDRRPGSLGARARRQKWTFVDVEYFDCNANARARVSELPTSHKRSLVRHKSPCKMALSPRDESHFSSPNELDSRRS